MVEHYRQVSMRSAQLPNTSTGADFKRKTSGDARGCWCLDGFCIADRVGFDPVLL